MKKDSITNAAKEIAAGNFLCDVCGPSDFDNFFENPDAYTVWQPFENWDYNEVFDAMEDLKDHAIIILEKYNA
jgi:hypothetical protein